MRRKCCSKTWFYNWSYNNPKFDRKLTNLHKRWKELDDFLCGRRKSEKKGKKI